MEVGKNWKYGKHIEILTKVEIRGKELEILKTNGKIRKELERRPVNLGLFRRKDDFSTGFDQYFLRSFPMGFAN